MMPGLEFAVEFAQDERARSAHGEELFPEDSTLADFAIYVDDECITRNKPHRSRLTQSKDEVFGPIAGVVEWLIDNWLPVLWETHTPFKRDIPFDGSTSGRPPIPGMKEAMKNWEGYVDSDSEIESMADWQHRHLLGHATSDLALPSIMIVPEDNSIVLCVGGLPSALSPSVDFVTASPRGHQGPIYVVRKTDFRQAAANLIETTLAHIARNGSFPEWHQWLEQRWSDAVRREADRGELLRWMLGDLAAERVQELEHTSPKVAGGLKQLLLDCPTVTRKPQLPPLEQIVKDYGVGDARDSLGGSPAAWQTVATDSISMSQPEFVQGYRLAEIVRNKLTLSNQPIHQLSGVLNALDVIVEKGSDSDLFQTAGCAVSGGRAHIIPSVVWHNTYTPQKERFAFAATLGRLLWRSRQRPETICVAQGDYALLSESRRANAFAANLLLPRRIFEEGGRLSVSDVEDLGSKYGISYSATRWHARNAGMRVDNIEAPDSWLDY